MNKTSTNPSQSLTIGRPSIEDVTLKVTRVHNKQMAPFGKVFYVVKLKHGRMNFGQRMTLDRSKMDEEQEQRFQEKVKEDFLNSVIEKYKL